MSIELYALKEDDGKKHSPFMVSKEDARKLNAKGHGIFFAVHDMDGKPRLGTNVKRVRAWFVDIDYGEKEEMLSMLMNAPLEPSIIIETKRGYHCYWMADYSATTENFRQIEEYLIERYGGDNNVKDLARIMRFPTYYHNKDINNRFMIKVVHCNYKHYSEKMMLGAFKIYKPPQKSKFEVSEIKIQDFKDDESIIKFFKVPAMVDKSGRHGFIMTKIGQMKHLGFNADERRKCVLLFNNHFSVALPDDEIESILRTT